MTATMTPDILSLCAAIDAGDETALVALADALEEAGDPMAAWLRVVIADRYEPAIFSDTHKIAFWLRVPDDPPGTLERSYLDFAIFHRLPRRGAKYVTDQYIGYSLSAAYIALAEALAG